MNLRDQQITRAILQALEELDGGQAVESILHAAVSLRVAPVPSLAEFEANLKRCDQNRWVVGVPSRVTGRMKWSLGDPGRAALAEL